MGRKPKSINRKLKEYSIGKKEGYSAGFRNGKKVCKSKAYSVGIVLAILVLFIYTITL